MADTTKNIFISHIHEDDSKLQDLKQLLSSRGYDIRDGSINSDKPNNATSEPYIKSEILAPRIRWASAVLVLISPGTHESTWVNWEIEYAVSQGKCVVGVWDHGAADCDVPDSLEKYASAVVGWQADRIIAALEGQLVAAEGPDGTLRPARLIPRHNC